MKNDKKYLIKFIEDSSYYSIEGGESRINSYIYDRDKKEFATKFTKHEAIVLITDMNSAGYNAVAEPRIHVTY